MLSPFLHQAHADATWTTESIPSRLARTCHSHTTSPGSTHALFAVLVRGETAFAPGKRELRGGLAGAGTWRDGPGTGRSRAGVHPR
jgi:hypothetical protein